MRLIVCITALIVMFGSVGFTGNESYASTTTGISVFVDGEKIVFDQEPINKDGRTLVPLRAIFEAMGMTVEWNQSTKKGLAYNDDMKINLQVGEKLVSVGNDRAGYIETELDVAPQIINDRTLVPVRFIGEASGSDVTWDNNTKSVMITTVPERKFLSSEDFNAGYEKVGYAVWKTNRSFVIQGYTESLPDGYVSDGFGKKTFLGQTYVGMYSNDTYNGFGTLTLESKQSVRGNFVNGKITYGEFIFSSGDIYKGPIEKNVPNGKGILLYTNGSTKNVTYLYGKSQVEVDPNKPYNMDGKLIQIGDTVKKYTVMYDIFVGKVIDINGNQVKVEWYDVQDIFGQSELYKFSDHEFEVAQTAGGITFNTAQWVDAGRLN